MAMSRSSQLTASPNLCATGLRVIGPSCLGSPARMTLVLGPAFILTGIITTGRKHPKISVITLTLDEGTAANRPSGSLACPASSTNICVKCPFCMPIPYMTDAETQVETTTLEAINSSFRGTENVPSEFSLEKSWSLVGRVSFCLVGAFIRKSSRLERKRLRRSAMMSAALLLGAHARIFAVGWLVRTWRIASTRTTVLPVPGLVTRKATIRGMKNTCYGRFRLTVRTPRMVQPQRAVPR